MRTHSESTSGLANANIHANAPLAVAINLTESTVYIPIVNGYLTFLFKFIIWLYTKLCILLRRLGLCFVNLYRIFKCNYHPIENRYITIYL